MSSINSSTSSGDEFQIGKKRGSFIDNTLEVIEEKPSINEKRDSFFDSIEE